MAPTRWIRASAVAIGGVAVIVWLIPVFASIPGERVSCGPGIVRLLPGDPPSEDTARSRSLACDRAVAPYFLIGLGAGVAALTIVVIDRRRTRAALAPTIPPPPVGSLD